MANQIPKYEKLIATLLLVGLAGIILGVLSGPFRREAALEKPARLAYPLPAGWKIIGNWETYPNGKLYEKIDGREPLFQDYGVIRLDFAAAEFKNKTFDIYLYHMRDSDGALGIYLASVSGEAREINLGHLADLAGGELRVLQGSVYLEIQPQEKSADEKLCLALARTLLTGIKPSKSSGPGLFDLLPKTGRIKGSLALNKDNAFGLKSLSNTFSAAYEEKGLQTDYLVRKISPAEGPKILQKVAAELKEFDGKILELKPNQLSGELFGKKLVLILENNMLLGAYGQEAGLDSLLKIIRKPGP